MLPVSVMQPYGEGCPGGHLVAMAQAAGQVLEPSPQLPPVLAWWHAGAFVDVLAWAVNPLAETVVMGDRLALVHSQGQGALQTLLPLPDACRALVMPPDVIATEIFDVLPVDGEQLHGLVAPEGMPVQCFVGRGPR